MVEVGHGPATPALVRERAPAKLNLGLRVLGRRPDGFHALDSVFVHLDLADELAVAPASHGASRDALARAPAGDAVLDARPLGLGDDNLVVRAWHAYRRVQPTLPSLKGTLRKRIPWGAGLGGGSADAGAALRAAAALAPAAVALDALAATLGSDVPFCWSGVAAARVGGRGEQVAPLVLPPRSVVLVHPGIEVAAADAYRWWAAAPVDVAPADEVLAAWRAGAPLPLVNALEPGVAARVPQVASALALLRSLTDAPAAMSGSGATCFALVAGAAAAAELAARVAARAPTWWVRAAVAGVPLTAPA